jgi:transcriptional regulator with XRE-family HTH domain
MNKERTMPKGFSHHHRQPGRNAKEKQEFRELVQELKRVSFEHRYTKSDLASELGISIAAINQWWSGYTPLPKPMHIERLRKFLSAHRRG